MLQPLILNLQGQVAKYQQLLELAREKNAVLIAADNDRLSAITNQEWELLKQAGKLETQRMEILSQLTAGVPDKLDSIDKAIGQAEGPEKQQLKAIKEDLLTTIESYKEINELNRQLLEVHLQYTEYMINVFSQAGSYGNSYDSRGRENDPGSMEPIGGGIIDSEV